MFRHLEFLRTQLKFQAIDLLQMLHHRRHHIFCLDALRKLVGVRIEIAFKVIRLDTQCSSQRPVLHQPQQLIAIRHALLRHQVRDLRHRQAFGNGDRMEDDLAVEEFREDFRRHHRRIQLVLTGPNFSVRRLRSSNEHERRPALDQPFSLEQCRNLLKGRSVRNHDDLGGRMLFRRHDRPLSPLNGLIRGHAENGDHDQQKNEHPSQLHE